MKTTFIFDIGPDLWLSANDRRVWESRAGRTAALRDWAESLGRFPARGAVAYKGRRPIAFVEIPDGEPARPAPFFDEHHPAALTVFVGWPSARPSDSDNAFPTVKALLDGLSDAGILTDDHDGIIHRRTYCRGPKPEQKGVHEITIVLESCGCPDCLGTGEP